MQNAPLGSILQYFWPSLSYHFFWVVVLHRFYCRCLLKLIAVSDPNQTVAFQLAVHLYWAFYQKGRSKFQLVHIMVSMLIGYSIVSKIDKTKIWMTNSSLMKGESIAKCSTWQYFWPAISDNWDWKPNFSLFESGCFTQVLLGSAVAQW